MRSSGFGERRTKNEKPKYSGLFGRSSVGEETKASGAARRLGAAGAAAGAWGQRGAWPPPWPLPWWGRARRGKHCRHLAAPLMAC